MSSHLARLLVGLLLLLSLTLLVFPAPILAAPLIRAVVVSPTPVRDHHLATITAYTYPHAVCTTRVVYASGYPATSASLRPAVDAGSSGVAQWHWTPATRYPGPATAAVRCGLNGAAQTARATFLVQ